ncbi:MAG: lipid II flippase Amj family protein [Lysinibacillus fusiformis]|nr:lipid II flippase Amj family protein [Lysinibacillus fusiformis]MCK1989039.1 lipid II flippase Amj family protein [Lysinibacillus fusiformis]MCR8853413.1 lipid II flippase Amj family protein [Lysinibacillus fusiformis]MCT6818454.1 lipid II flippase Amj family protein [Lysinibacillus fusiformis]MCT6927200.1 lipid II flippase Amj family protein [Lysinibacillus fusiformis]
MELITNKLIMIALFILIIHAIETLAYAVRLSGARVRLLASALALFNVMVMVSRLANMMQQPFTGSLVDTAPVDDALTHVEQQFRIIIGAASLGTLIGILLIPTFVAIFSRAIVHLAEERGSIPALMKKGFTYEYVRRGLKHIHKPRFTYLKDIGLRDIPLQLFITNIVITAIYTIGVLSALYATLLVPELKTTAVMASGLINGIATILLILFIDPKISILADDVINKRGSYLDLKKASVMMMFSRFLGTIVAQLLFIPGAHYVAWFAKLIA